MMIDLLEILASGAASQPTTQAVVHAVEGWSQSIMSAYGSMRGPAFGGSLALCGLTFTAFSTLSRIKDKLYDSEEYHAMVRRARAIDESLEEYGPYRQLTWAYELTRWAAVVNVIYHFVSFFWFNWLSAIGGCVLILGMLALLAFVVGRFHANLATITEMDQHKADQQRLSDAAKKSEEPKPYARLRL